MVRLLAAVGLAFALTGCATTASPASDVPIVVEAPSAIFPTPTAVTIPAIGVSSSLIPTGLMPDGTAEVPPLERPEQASWFEPGVIPGQPGPAVLLGHVDGGGRPGVFNQLDQLTEGDEIRVDRAGVKPLWFRVTRIERYAKDEFPTDAVYGDTGGPELRLITCGGAFDAASGNYLDNIVAYATHMDAP